MPLDAHSAASTVTSEVSAISSDGELRDLGIARADFCEIWPKAKPVLQLVSGVAVLIPGIGKTAGAVLSGLIKIGDQIHSDVCQ